MATTRLTNINLLASLLIGLVGASTLAMLPALIGEIERALHFNESRVGVISSAELGGITIGSACGAVLLRKLGIARTATVGLIITCATNAATVMATGYHALILARAAAGSGAGILVAIAYAALGLSDRAERHFGYYCILQGVFGAVAMRFLPMIADTSGIDAIFLFLAAGSLFCLLLTKRLPVHVFERSASQVTQTPVIAWFALLAIVVYFVAQGSIWVYLQLIATSAGLPLSGVANALAVCSIAGMAGPFVATILENRFGLIKPIALASLLSVVSLALLRFDLTLSGFLVAACCFNFAWNVSVPYQLACLTRVDRSGTAISWAAPASFVGLATGPFFAAAIGAETNFDRLVSFSGTTGAIAFVGLIPALLRGKGVPAETGGEVLDDRKH